MSVSLEDEIGVPKSAFLPSAGSREEKEDFSLPPVFNRACLLCDEEKISIDRSSSLRRKDTNTVPRCLIVGRQASVADLRLDHKSISRKHAAFFYDSFKDDDPQLRLLLLPMPTKHGTFVNSQRIPDTQPYIVSDGDRIQFGNYDQKQFQLCWTPETIQKLPSPQEPMKDINKTTTTTTSGRQQREAEIAVMMASLEEAPTYTKYQPPTETAFRSDTARLQQLVNHNILTHMAEFAHIHTKCVTSMAMDPAGSRLVTGSNDYTLQMYDFGGMDASHRPFMEIHSSSSSEEGQFPLSDVHYSPSGDKIVVATTSSCVKVFNRDGQELIHCIKGDVYVADMSQTRGHVQSVTACQWHPHIKDVFLTTSLDGSARLWDVAKGKFSFEKRLICSFVYKIKNVKNGQRTSVLCLCYHPGGRQFAIGTSCGSIQIWNCCRAAASNKSKLRPERYITNAHGGVGIPVTSVVYSPNGELLASRAGESQERDDSVRLWDVTEGNKTNNSEPIRIIPHVSTIYETSNTAFSPDGKVLCVGGGGSPIVTNTDRSSYAAIPKRQDTEGFINFYNISKDDPKASKVLEPVFHMKMPSTIVKVLWHPKLNQIICGASDGTVRVLYDPNHSKKGVLLSSVKSVKQKNALERLLLERRDPQPITNIFTPNALPMFRDPEKDTKRKRDLERMDPVKTKRPEAPTTSKHLAGGRSSVSINFQQFVVQSTIKNKNIAGKDPREELFKYQEGKSIVERAYAGNVNVLAEKTAEEEEEEAKKR